MIRPLCLLAAVLFLFGCSTTGEGARRDALDTPSTATSHAAGQPAPEASPVEDFEFHVRVELLEGGQYRRTVVERYRLLNASPDRYFARLEFEFDPDEDDPPELTATVTLPDGTVKTLDPATVAETPAEGSSGDNFTSRRRLVAPLPALVAGARIERTMVSVRSKPRLTVGRTFSMPLALHVPVKALSFTLDHPAGQQVLSRVLETEVTPVREERDGRVVTTWSRTDVPGISLDPTLPPEERRFPTVMISSAASWSEVAGAYHAAVASRLSSKGLDAVVRELKPASKAPRDVAAAALEWMHHRLRYTGLDFSNSGIIPQTPEVTLQRGYGDCKDLSAFLVALLDAAGVRAQLVLVHTEDWHDAADELAGLNRFNHAIVQVPGTTPLWIDPTLRGLPVGTLDPMSMARMALVVAPATTGLIRTPVGTPTDNRAQVHNEITLPGYGLAKVKTIRTITGSRFALPRSRAQSLTAEQLNQEVAKSTREAHDSETFTFRHSDPLSGLTPFEETLEVQGSRQSVTADTEALAHLGFEALIDYLPTALRLRDGETPEDAQRQGPVFVGAPQTIEVVTRVHAPPLFELRGAPAPREDQVGPMRWSYVVTPLENGAEARATVTLEARVIPADQVDAVRASLDTLLSSSNSLEFANRPMRLMEEGKLQDAVKELRTLSQAAPKDALVRAMLARAALAAGLTDEALTLAREAKGLGPMQPPVGRAVGWILSVNPDGILYGKGAARAEALEALRSVRKQEPGESAALKTEIELLARNEHGVLGGKGADIEGALALLKQKRAPDEDLGMGDFHALLLWEAGRDRELLETKEIPETELVGALRLAARARSQGPKAALTWLDQHARGAQRDELLAGTAYMLFKARAYPEAHQLARQVRDPALGQLAILAGKTYRREASPYTSTDPVNVISEGIAHAMKLTTRVDAKTLNLQEPWTKQMRAQLSPVFASLGGAEEAVLDAMRASLVGELEEIPGVGVVARLSSDFGGEERHLLERQGKGYRFHPLATHDQQAEAAWKDLAQGHLDNVRGWLRLWHGAMEKEADHRQLEALRELAKGGESSLTLALALGTLPAETNRPALEKAVRALAHARKTVGQKHALAGAVGRSHVIALSRLGRHDEALAENDKIRDEGAYVRDELALLVRATILRDAKRLDVLEKEGRALIERPSTRKVGFVMLTFAAEARKDPAAYRALHVKMVAADFERLESLNNAAWSALFMDRIEDEDLQRAELAIGPAGDRKGALDTLAVLLAQRGDVDRAVATLARLRGDSEEPETAPSVRYARARIAEELGFTRAAKALYASVPAGAKSFINDLHPLAQKRLQGLAVPAPAPASTPALRSR